MSYNTTQTTIHNPDNLISTKAIDFSSGAVMENNEINHNFNLFEYIKGSKAVLLFYPLNFTFVCPSEIIACNNRMSNFIDLNTKIMALSIDSVFSHHAWRNTDLTKGGIGNVQFPLISDMKGDISRKYGVMYEEKGVAFRASIVIDEQSVIRHVSMNDLPIGRNIDELIRILKAIDFHNKHGEVCPANWDEGKTGMQETKESVSDYLASHSHKL